MVPDSQVRIAQFLKAVALGFAHTRPEIILFFLIVIASLAAIVIFFVAQNRKARREFAHRSRQIFERLIQRLGLSEHETELLGRLVGTWSPVTPRRDCWSTPIFSMPACAGWAGQSFFPRQPSTRSA